MKSRAHFKSHPLHPMLVHFPIGLFVATLFFDVLAFLNLDEGYLATAKYLNIAAIVMALLAAIPGIIDYRHTVPPNSSAKKRATKHGLLNVCVVILFAISLYARHKQVHGLIVIGIELGAIILLTIAGWMGGTLVNRNQIGIDVRYAGAGKWKECHINTKETLIAVTDEDALALNQMKLVHINGKRIVIALSDSGYSAFDDHCTHRGGSLAAGALICDTVQCPWHGSQFNIQSGVVKAGPAKQGIGIYKTIVKDGKVYVEV